LYRDLQLAFLINTLGVLRDPMHIFFPYDYHQPKNELCVEIVGPKVIALSNI
jgi:hypothetical protein